IIQHHGDIDATAESVVRELSSGVTTMGFVDDYYDFDKMDLLAKHDLMASLAGVKRFSVPLFMAVLKDAGMDEEELYRQYIGKNVLNFFRQDNGYKQGTYVKIWNGLEDNEYLVQIMNQLD